MRRAWRYAGEYGEIIAMDQFGASAPAGALFPHFGFSVENVVEKALQSMEAVKASEPEVVVAVEIPVLEATELVEK